MYIAKRKILSKEKYNKINNINSVLLAKDVDILYINLFEINYYIQFKDFLINCSINQFLSFLNITYSSVNSFIKLEFLDNPNRIKYSTNINVLLLLKEHLNLLPVEKQLLIKLL